MSRGPRLKRNKRPHLFGRAAEPERVRDFRDPETRRADAALDGTWWRCRVHGLTDDAIILSSAAYCPVGDCSSACLLAHAVPLYDSPRQSWGWAGPDDSPVRIADDIQAECWSCVRDIEHGEIVIVHSRTVGERHLCLSCGASSRVRAVRQAARDVLGSI